MGSDYEEDEEERWREQRRQELRREMAEAEDQRDTNHRKMRALQESLEYLHKSKEGFCFMMESQYTNMRQICEETLESDEELLVRFQFEEKDLIVDGNSDMERAMTKGEGYFEYYEQQAQYFEKLYQTLYHEYGSI